MSATPVPDSLACRICTSLLVSAVTFPCCETNMCRGCAIRQIIRNKSRCGHNTNCGKEVNVTDLRPNMQIRKRCLEFKEGQSEEVNDKHLGSPKLPENQPNEHTKEYSHLRDGGTIEETNIKGSTSVPENQHIYDLKGYSKDGGIIDEFDYDVHGPVCPNLLEFQSNENTKKLSDGEIIEEFDVESPASPNLLESPKNEVSKNHSEGVAIEGISIKGSTNLPENQHIDDHKEYSEDGGNIEEFDNDVGGLVYPDLLESQSNENTKELSNGEIIEESDNEIPASPNLLESPKNEESIKHPEGGTIEEMNNKGSTNLPENQHIDDLKEYSKNGGIIEEFDNDVDGPVSPNLLEFQSNENTIELSDGEIIEDCDNEGPASPNLLESEQIEDSKKPSDGGNIEEFAITNTNQITILNYQDQPISNKHSEEYLYSKGEELNEELKNLIEDNKIHDREHARRPSKWEEAKNHFWKCPHCLLLFPDAKMLKYHKIKKCERHNKSCGQCSYKFHTLQALKVYCSEEHGVNKGFKQCARCKTVMASKSIVKHSKKKHWAVCGADGCDAVCTSDNTLWIHRIKVHGEGVLVNKEDFESKTVADAEERLEVGSNINSSNNRYNTASLNPYYLDPNSIDKTQSKKRKLSEERQTTDNLEAGKISNQEDSSFGSRKTKKKRTLDVIVKADMLVKFTDFSTLQDSSHHDETTIPDDKCPAESDNMVADVIQTQSNSQSTENSHSEENKKEGEASKCGSNERTGKGEERGIEADEHRISILSNTDYCEVISATSETIEDTTPPPGRPPSPIEVTISSIGRPVSQRGDCSPCDLDLLRRCRGTSLTLSACSKCPVYFVTCSEGPRSVSVPPGSLISLVGMVSEDLASLKDLLSGGVVKVLGHLSPDLQKKLAREKLKKKQGVPLPYPAVRPIYGKYLMVTVVNNSSETQVYQRGMQLGQVQLMRGLLPVLELPNHPVPMTLSRKMNIPPLGEHTDLTLTTSLPPGIHVKLILSRSIFPGLRFSLGGSWDEVNVVQLGGNVNIGVINTSTRSLALETRVTVAWGSAINPQDWIKDRLTLGRLS